ncbi:hypothetical protein EGW08_003220 [Elysia chlorotica]|uniref:C-type lectin domain-containing protein n=1 Tax=Elysia chlorotica TaxID=188477 RepID=A0A3S0ZY85_ELYCH|nr:hypothetical protein EGW08_003220 [Elysia chlorotica]
MIAHLIPVFLLVFAGYVPPGVEGTLQAYGCDQGWTHYDQHCYALIVGQWDSYSAKNVCSDLGSSPASVWSQAEMNFISSLWQHHRSDNPVMWTGLQGQGGGAWVWHDKSSVYIQQSDSGEYWSALDKLHHVKGSSAGQCLTLTGHGSPALMSCDQPAGGVACKKHSGEYWSALDKLHHVKGSSAGQCLTLTGHGSPALMSCDQPAGGVACKKPLPRVFAMISPQNQSSPGDQLDAVQWLERLLPPVLKRVPSQAESPLDELEVATDTHCAFSCHRTSPCRVIELSCLTEYNCGTYRCLLFAGKSM